ncbi:hypothetical protein [Streptomyces sp. Ac-502]|uniref:hypothetical protein n=1 Tax=Streptomyces sp. Ac-502 TaxID=3342801 RepID=UPI00386250EC
MEQPFADPLGVGGGAVRSPEDQHPGHAVGLLGGEAAAQDLQEHPVRAVGQVFPGLRAVAAQHAVEHLGAHAAGESRAGPDGL